MKTRRFVTGVALGLLLLISGLRVDVRFPDRQGAGGREWVAIHGIALLDRPIAPADVPRKSPWPVIGAIVGGVGLGSVATGLIFLVLGRKFDLVITGDSKDDPWRGSGSHAVGKKAMAASETEARQRAVCQEQGAAFSPPGSGTRVGIAIATLSQVPLHGLRVAEHGGVCGWYLYGGETWSDDPEFYQPLCVEHLGDVCPESLPFLALPPGWRFLVAGEDIDVWFDASILDESEST